MLSTHASNLQTVSSNTNIGSIHNSNTELLQINRHHRKERCFSSCLLQLVSPWNKYKPIKHFRKITEPPNSGCLLVTEDNTVRKPCSCTHFNSWSLLGLFADTVLKRETASPPLCSEKLVLVMNLNKCILSLFDNFCLQFCLSYRSSKLYKEQPYLTLWQFTLI